MEVYPCTFIEQLMTSCVANNPTADWVLRFLCYIWVLAKLITVIGRNAFLKYNAYTPRNGLPQYSIGCAFDPLNLEIGNGFHF